MRYRFPLLLCLFPSSGSLPLVYTPSRVNADICPSHGSKPSQAAFSWGSVPVSLLGAIGNFHSGELSVHSFIAAAGIIAGVYVMTHWLYRDVGCAI